MNRINTSPKNIVFPKIGNTKTQLTLSFIDSSVKLLSRGYAFQDID